MTKQFTIYLVAGLLTLTSFTAVAQVHVSGYTRSNGTYVAPSVRSSPNSTKLDNYSTRGNANPYTGQQGTHNPYAAPSNTYSQPQQQSQYTQNPYSSQSEQAAGDGY